MYDLDPGLLTTDKDESSLAGEFARELHYFCFPLRKNHVELVDNTMPVHCTMRSGHTMIFNNYFTDVITEIWLQFSISFSSLFVLWRNLGQQASKERKNSAHGGLNTSGNVHFTRKQHIYSSDLERNNNYSP